MNTIREIQKINDQELELGIAGTPASWHAKYIKSAWVYVGNLDYALSEGDVICVLSQFGEIEDLHLARDDETGKSKGFAFCKYEDARSCILAVDNFCGIQLCSRSLRVDHVENYRLPKNLQKTDGGDADGSAEDQQHDDVNVTVPGHSYRGQELGSNYSLSQGQDLFAKPAEEKEESDDNANRDDDDRERRKEERRLLREQKAERKREREEKRAEREEKRRSKKKAKKSGKRQHKDRKRERRDSSESGESSGECD